LPDAAARSNAMYGVWRIKRHLKTQIKAGVKSTSAQEQRASWMGASCCGGSQSTPYKAYMARIACGRRDAYQEQIARFLGLETSSHNPALLHNYPQHSVPSSRPIAVCLPGLPSTGLNVLKLLRTEYILWLTFIQS
jgi:hypothetical protein